MSKSDDDFSDALHAAFMDLVGLLNRPEPDEVMLALAGVQLDRALFPLLSRIGLKAPISVVELGKVSGKDHSTVSRQVARLEELGLVERVPSPTDQRVRLLAPSAKGAEMVGKLRIARRKAIGQWTRDWDRADRQKFLETLQMIVREGNRVPLEGARPPAAKPRARP
jgi:DNA-binding MarR family transcriptional regulator